MLGAIADDFTGATDLATNLVTRGFKTTVTIGVPGIDFRHQGRCGCDRGGTQNTNRSSLRGNRGQPPGPCHGCVV